MTASKQFQRNIEDFVCGHCGAEVTGNGYTNHCPVCLWSKHVDVNPGDRAANCGGLMEPTEVLTEGDSYALIHTCVKCKHTKKNKLSPDDDINIAVELARNIANKTHG